jgi:hypothetical protein
VKAPNDPNATPQNKVNRDGKYVPTTFRFSPDDLKKLEDLCREYEDREGLPVTRAELVRHLIHTEHRKRCKQRR